MADAEQAEAQLEELLAEQRAAVAGLAAALAAGEGDGAEARAVRPAPPPLGPSGAWQREAPRCATVVEFIELRTRGRLCRARLLCQQLQVLQSTIQRSVEGWGHLRPGGRTVNS